MAYEISPYSADDSDNVNERNNYWANWERAERMASATTCDFMHHCFECPLACGDDEEVEIIPCSRVEEVRGLRMVFEAPMLTKTKCAMCGSTIWRKEGGARPIANEGKGLSYCNGYHWNAYLECYINVMKSIGQL